MAVPNKHPPDFAADVHRSLDAWAGILADPFVEGTQLEGGHIANSFNGVAHILNRILQNPDRRALLTLTTTDGHYRSLEHVSELLKAAAEMATQAAKEVKDAKSFTVFLKDWQKAIEGLPEGQILFVPGGWLGMTSVGSVVHLLERHKDGLYSFTTCNSGTGLNYHPSKPFCTGLHTKEKFKTCIRIENIPRAKMMDSAFWCLLFSLWLKQPASEYHRVEVIYDVLLPWLAEKLLPAALLETKDDDCAEWRTPQRSNTSSTRSTMEALRYVLRRAGLTSQQLKQLSFLIRWEMVIMANEELEQRLAPPEENPQIGLEAYQSLQGGATQLLSGTDEDVPLTKVAGKTIALYFSGQWCGPCKAFTPKLIHLYEHLQQRGESFEIILISADRDQDAFRTYFRSMPWLALPFVRRDLAAKLRDLFQVEGIPSLVLLAPDGKLITKKGVQAVMSDACGAKFPWDPASMPLEALTSTETELLRLGCEQVGLAAVKESVGRRLSAANLHAVREVIEAVQFKVARMPVEADPMGMPPPRLQLNARATLQHFPGYELLMLSGMDKYAGQTANAAPPILPNLLLLPDRVSTIAAAIDALRTCYDLARQTLERTHRGSRLALQYQVIGLITSLFTRTLPMPKARRAAGGEGEECLWRTMLPKQQQLQALRVVHQLLLLFGEVWQAVENPSRDFDAERSTVGTCALCVFDVLLRTPAADNTLIVTDLLLEDGGASLSMSVCQNCRDLERTSRMMELTTPALAKARSDALEYLTFIRDSCAKCILDFRMPEKIEIKK